jgi:transcriptional regulator with XRE-family HTH domain
MGLLGWSGRELAEKSGVTANTVSRILNGSNPLAETMLRLQQALEGGGVEFIPRGVRLRDDAK